MTIGIIGAGRVGGGLARALAAHGYRVGAVASRRRTSADALASHLPGCDARDTPQEVADACDLVFIATPDDAIGPVAASVGWRPGTAVVHCSGAVEIDALAPAQVAGAQVGGFHPMQIFEDPASAVRALAGATIALEAGEPLLGRLRAMAEAIGGRPITLPPGARVVYHASASFASPFVVVMLEEAARLWEGIGLTADDALAALLPLARGTLDIVARGGTARATRGPAARGDVGTTTRHLEALGAADPEAARVYRFLLRKALPLARMRGSLTAEGAVALERLLAREG